MRRRSRTTAQRMHEFIAMLAHELRNPLAPIRNAVALMERKGIARSGARVDAPDASTGRACS